MRRLLFTLIALGLFPLAHAATAPQTGLAMVCEVPAGATLPNPFYAGKCQAQWTREYIEPVAGSWVLACNPAVDTTCLPGTTKAQPNWNTDANYIWRQWPVPASYGVLVCMKALTPGAAMTTAQADVCTAGEDDVNKPLILASAVVSTVPVGAPPVVIPLPTNIATFSITFTCPGGVTPQIPAPTVSGATVTIAGAMCPAATGT